MPPLAQQTPPAAPPAATSHQGCPQFLSLLSTRYAMSTQAAPTLGTGGEREKDPAGDFYTQLQRGLCQPQPSSELQLGQMLLAAVC